jgi:hypothetical protein
LSYDASAACTALLMTAVNQAQAAEGLHTFSLPTGYSALTIGQQMFVLVNLERISRQVPPLAGISTYLSAAATSAAAQAEDPVFRTSYGPVRVWAPPGGGYYAFGGAWSGNAVNAAAAMFGWMYDDGWGGPGKTSNGACTGPTSAGCWGHRDELLGKFSGTACPDCVAGTGYVSPAAHGWQESYDFMIVRPVTFPTPLTFTWNGNVVPHLPAGWERRLAA